MSTPTLSMTCRESDGLLQRLKDWSEQGWIRRLDSAFAAFLADLCPEASAPVLLAAALVAHLEGRGHSCLRVDAMLLDAEALLGWPAQALDELRELLTDLPPDPEVWFTALRASPLVWVEGEGDAVQRPWGPSPLVLADSKLYLRRYWGYERRVACQVLARSQAAGAVDLLAARQWLDLLFPAPTEVTTEVDWQKVACGVALGARLAVITGGPGTGKTYTAARLLALLFAVDPAPQLLRVALAAPTGKAAARLKQSIEAALTELQELLGDRLLLRELASHIGPARTLHSLLGASPDSRRFRADAEHPLALDLLIVDEASMVHLEMMASLLEALPSHARIILLGDKDQLASVEAGAVLGDLCRDAEQGRYRQATAQFIESVTGQRLPAEQVQGGPALAQRTVMLRRSRRFGGPIGALAEAVNAGNAQAASALLQAGAGLPLLGLTAPTPHVLLRLALQGRPGADGGYGHYLSMLRQRPGFDRSEQHAAWVLALLRAFDRFRLLCALRDGEWGSSGLNAAVERELVAQGLLFKRGDWYEGRPVMVTRNNPGVGVFNGDIGIALKPFTPDAPLRAYFLDGATVRSVAVSRLAEVETAFAMTVHKSQGSEFEHCVLVLPQAPSRVLTRELVYTGITRAREAFTLVSGRPQAFADALAQRTQRASGLLERLSDQPADPELGPDST